MHRHLADGMIWAMSAGFASERRGPRSEPIDQETPISAMVLVPALFALVMVSLAPRPSEAQEEESSSPNIELGSSRIGGPGLTDRERRVVRSWSEPDEYVTEENLPDKGSRKRIPSLHILAERYFGGQQWKEACRFYQMILDEAGMDGVTVRKGAQKRAGRSFFECAERAFSSSDYEQVERNLQTAEKLGFRSSRNEFLRRKVVREQFRRKLSGGDVEGAHRLYDKYQSMGETDDEERIRFGEKLAEMAKRALDQDDRITFDELMAKLEAVAPKNTDYRAMKAEMEGNSALLKNILLVVGAAVIGVFLLSFLSRWRARARVGNVGSKNPFLDDDI